MQRRLVNVAETLGGESDAHEHVDGLVLWGVVERICEQKSTDLLRLGAEVDAGNMGHRSQRLNPRGSVRNRKCKEASNLELSPSELSLSVGYTA